MPRSNIIWLPLLDQYIVATTLYVVTMPGPPPDLDGLLIRQASLSVVLHGLMDQMIAKDLLTGSDIAAIRHYAMDMTTDLQNAASGQARATGIRIAEEVEAFLRVVVGLPADPNKDEGIS